MTLFIRKNLDTASVVSRLIESTETLKHLMNENFPIQIKDFIRCDSSNVEIGFTNKKVGDYVFLKWKSGRNNVIVKHTKRHQFIDVKVYEGNTVMCVMHFDKRTELDTVKSLNYFLDALYDIAKEDALDSLKLELVK